jgi:hypothetical protein
MYFQYDAMQVPTQNISWTDFSSDVDYSIFTAVVSVTNTGTDILVPVRDGRFVLVSGDKCCVKIQLVMRLTRDFRDRVVADVTSVRPTEYTRKAFRSTAFVPRIAECALYNVLIGTPLSFVELPDGEISDRPEVTYSVVDARFPLYFSYNDEMKICKALVAGRRLSVPVLDGKTFVVVQPRSSMVVVVAMVNYTPDANSTYCVVASLRYPLPQIQIDHPFVHVVRNFGVTASDIFGNMVIPICNSYWQRRTHNRVRRELGMIISPFLYRTFGTGVMSIVLKLASRFDGMDSCMNVNVEPCAWY